MPALSKSRYLSGLQCAKRLWLEIHDPGKATPAPGFQRFLFEQGLEVGRRARLCFPGGVLIQNSHKELSKAVTDTQAAIAQGATTLFEGAFHFDDTYAIADVLIRGRHGWDLIEVKSSTRVKDEHLDDLAIQRYVLEGAGLPIQSTQVMVLNGECVYPDLSKLFKQEDVTDEVLGLLPDARERLRDFKRLLELRQAPPIPIGEHCATPYQCPFKNHCWAGVGDRKLAIGIPRLSGPKKEELRERNILFLDELPADFPLTPKQQAYVDGVHKAFLHVNKEGIRAQLATLAYPVHFFDFETFGPAIPRFVGMKPYQHFPFQFSCHRLEEDGTLHHGEYLHLDPHDPRPRVIKSLLECLGARGSIVAYNASFERGVLQSLTTAFPAHRAELEAVVARLWDQMSVFKKNYHHSAFGGSISLKKVLPIVVPHLNYGNLAIQQGDEAQLAWGRMLQMQSGAERECMIADLQAYCRLDTLAMVEIHQVLTKLVASDAA